MRTTLGEIVSLLQDETLFVSFCPEMGMSPDNLPISGCDCDSRFVRPNHLFVAKGQAFKPEYLIDAIEAGAVAYMCDESWGEELATVAVDTPGIVVSDIRRATALVSPMAWGRPDADLRVIGITGTKGKSTTACMIREILDVANGKGSTGLIGSIETYDGVERLESVNTTPEPPDLWRHLANAKESGIRDFVMEVSSHALKYDRTLGLRLDVAGFLNLGRDHISPIEHPDFEDYFQSKLLIFRQADTAIVNLSTDRVDEVTDAAKVCGRTVSFSPDGRGGDAWASGIGSDGSTTHFVAHLASGGEIPITIPFPGLFNVENALCAATICDVLGIGGDAIARGIGQTRVPGRMEILRPDDSGITCLIDYAHNKLSYRRLFSSLEQEFPEHEIVVVLGAPGDKAQERRRELPIEAARWADLLIYTEEDPAHEDPADICAEMVANTPDGVPCMAIVDREEAISFAVRHAKECGRKALVCLLAKGDETRQHRGDGFVAMRPDGEVFLEAMAGR